MKITFTLYCCLVIIFFISCKILDGNQYGTGSINVVMDGQYYDLDKVTGTEYMGFFCQGNLLNKSLGIFLGGKPKVGDTLFLNIRKDYDYNAPYISYGNPLGLTEGGRIIITRHINNTFSGTFQCKVVVETDTINFQDGNFNVEFKPSP